MFDDETKYHYNGISSDNNNYLADTYQQVNRLNLSLVVPVMAISIPIV